LEITNNLFPSFAPVLSTLIILLFIGEDASFNLYDLSNDLLHKITGFLLSELNLIIGFFLSEFHLKALINAKGS